MTVVEGSVADIGMSPMSGTLFARPVTMRREGNTVITTERTPFHIDGGVLVDVDLVPGPAMLSIEVGSHVRRNFRVTVPPSGPIQLADLLEDAYEYTPEVVSVVAGYRNDAYAARQRAIDAADAADRSAGDAAGSAAAASRSAGDAADEAGDAAEFRRLAGLSADAAAGSAGTAGGHASAAAESKRLAEVAHQNTVDSLAGLTGRVKVTEDRLPTKADLIGGRIDPAQLIGSGVSGSGIRVDTTVGTRVFVGGTMIYGDTGWRDVTALLLPEWQGSGSYVQVKRTLDSIHVAAQVMRATAGATREIEASVIGLPQGFQPNGYGTFGAASLAYVTPGLVGRYAQAPLAVYGWSGSWTAGDRVQFRFVAAANTTGGNAWPTTLPGAPA